MERDEGLLDSWFVWLFWNKYYIIMKNVKLKIVFIKSIFYYRNGDVW